MPWEIVQKGVQLDPICLPFASFLNELLFREILMSCKTKTVQDNVRIQLKFPCCLYRLPGIPKEGFFKILSWQFPNSKQQTREWKIAGNSGTLIEKDSNRRSSIKLVNFTIPCWSGIGVLCTCTRTLAKGNKSTGTKLFKEVYFRKQKHIVQSLEKWSIQSTELMRCGNTIRFSLW
jgi:hypothetical protein